MTNGEYNAGELAGRVAFITGGGGGIGRGIAVALAQAGAAVAVNDILPERAEAAAADIVRAGGRGLALPGDVTDPTTMRQMVRTAAEAFGPVDLLMTCAANYEKRSYLDAMAEGEWEGVLNCHLNGTVYACQAVIPGMKARRWGRIVTFSSTVGLTGFPGASHYAAAKAAVENLTKSLAVELAPHGINVNCIAPGYTETSLLVGPYSDAERAAIPKVIPLGRIGTPEDMIGVALLLVGRGGDFITGTTIRVDGGRSLALQRPLI